MTCEAYEEIIAAHVDGVLTPVELHEVEQHLQSCTQCSQLFAEQSEFCAAFNARRFLVSLPKETEERLRSALEKEADSSVPVFSFFPSLWSRLSAFFTLPRFAIGLAAASILVALFLSNLFSEDPKQGLFPQAVDSYQTATAEHYPLAYDISDPLELEMTFNLSGELDFVTQVPDLRPAGYRLRGGNITSILNHPAAIAIYDKRNDHIVCVRQRGKLPAMPRNVEVTHGHYVYTRNGYTIVYSQFRRHYCLLISRLPKDQFLRSLGIE